MNSNKLIDGFLSNGFAVFGDPGRGGYVTCGFLIAAPVIENASISYLNQCEAELRAFLRILNPSIRLQISWSLTSECSDVLLDYFDNSGAPQGNEFARRQRLERFSRYCKRMDAGLLRFQQVHIYVGTMLSAGGDFDQSIRVAGACFDSLECEIRGCFERLGGSVTRMEEADLFCQMYTFCNPSLKSIHDVGQQYDPGLGIMANCLTSDANAVVGKDAGFFMDGHFFGCLVLSSLPRSTYSGIALCLTGLPIGDFGITMNIAALDAQIEINREEGEIGRLRNSLRGGGPHRSKVALDQRSDRIQRLAGNEEVPFSVQTIIRVWDKTHDGVQGKLGNIRSALTRMQLAKGYSLSFPTSARNYFRASFPGWGMWDTHTDFRLPIEDGPLANILPVSGSPNLGAAEALYDGANGNLIGINTFAGPVGNEAPQHAVIVGKSGSGKSSFAIDLFIQTSILFEFTLIVDNGLSYQTFAQTIDPSSKTFVIRPNGDVTLNYLDVSGDPLSPDHLVDAESVIHQMAGRRADEDRDRYRRAVISKCLNQFYRDYARDWLNADPARIDEVGRYAVLLSREMLLTGIQDISQQHWDLGEWAEENEEEAEDKLYSITEDEIRTVPGEVVESVAFAFIGKKDAPTHTDFCEWMDLESRNESCDMGEIATLATLLKPWKRVGGSYGSLFDGVGNIGFRGKKVVHLELGEIPESAPNLKELASLVVISQIRKEIRRRPRNVRKRVVFEELASFVTMPGAGDIVREFYMTMRKFNTWVCSVAQQLTGLDSTAESLLGNIRLAILMKQSSPAEVDYLADVFQLPDSAKETLLKLPEPSIDGGAPFLCWRNSGPRPEIVSGFHVASPEMLYVASSGGEHFESRKAALAKWENPIDGIIAEASKKV